MKNYICQISKGNESKELYLSFSLSDDKYELIRDTMNYIMNLRNAGYKNWDMINRMELFDLIENPKLFIINSENEYSKQLKSEYFIVEVSSENFIFEKLNVTIINEKLESVSNDYKLVNDDVTTRLYVYDDGFTISIINYITEDLFLMSEYLDFFVHDFKVIK